MIVLWYGLWATFLGCAATSIYMYRWYCAEPQNEPFYAALSAATVTALAGIGLLVQYFFDEKSSKERQARSENERLHQKWLLDRIEGERPNFKHIQEKRVYSGEPHRRAVEDHSFALLDEELEKVSNQRKYRKLTMRALKESNRIQQMPPLQKNVSNFMNMLDLIEAKLRKSLS